jgi:hypothetical protein
VSEEIDYENIFKIKKICQSKSFFPLSFLLRNYKIRSQFGLSRILIWKKYFEKEIKKQFTEYSKRVKKIKVFEKYLSHLNKKLLTR